MSDSHQKAARPLAMIVAASENDVIGREGDLPWRLSADLKRFKSLTMGHHLLMGRKTFESIGRLLPGRTTVIITRQQGYQFKGAAVAHSLEQAVAISAGDDSPFLVGGAELYEIGMPRVTRLFLTRVHTQLEGDAVLPEIDWSKWDRVEARRFSRDEKNEFDYSFEDFVLKAGPLGFKKTTSEIDK